MRIFIDLQNLNHAFDKDNYHVPPMEYILKCMSGYELFDLLYEFLRYNQVLVEKLNRLNTMFQTKWGMYSYRRTSLILMNEKYTFQMEIHISFKVIIIRIMVVYLNDVTIYSNKREDHHKHLK
jgi:hypothetical protein